MLLFAYITVENPSPKTAYTPRPGAYPPLAKVRGQVRAPGLLWAAMYWCEG